MNNLKIKNQYIARHKMSIHESIVLKIIDKKTLLTSEKIMVKIKKCLKSIQINLLNTSEEHKINMKKWKNSSLFLY
jgi:hypothetical protein